MTTLFNGTITAAGTVVSGTISHMQDKVVIGLGAVLTYGSGGTTAKAFVQTSFDDGATYHDVVSFAFGTVSASKAVTLGWPVSGTAHYTITDGSLADNTVSGAVVGELMRVKLITAGTYAGTTTLLVSASVKKF